MSPAPDSTSMSLPTGTRRRFATPRAEQPTDALLHDADQLLVDELVHPIRAELASEAGTLNAPERQLGAVKEDAVHEDHAGLDVVGDAVALLGVSREDVGAEAERRVVGDPDRLLLGRDPVNARDGPEELLPVGVALGADTGEDRRAEEVVLPVAVENGLGALGLGPVDLVLKALRRGRRREWAHRRVLGRIPGLHLLHLLRELREEVVVELVDDDEPLRGVTRLARVVEARLHRGVDDLVEVLGR